MAQGCDWRGVHAELVKHVKSQHAGLIHSGNELLVSFPIQMMANSSRNYVLYAFDEMFRVNFQRGPGASLVHGLVIYLGPIDNARNYNFSFKVTKYCLLNTSKKYKLTTVINIVVDILTASFLK